MTELQLDKDDRHRRTSSAPGTCPPNALPIGIGAPDVNTGDPCHTTRHAGPHRAVRKVEVRAFGFAGLDLGSPSLVAACPSTLLVPFGLHPIVPNEPSFRKHLWPWTCETLALLPPLRSALRFAEVFRPSAPRCGPAGFCSTTTASADFSRRCSCTVALSGTSEISPGNDTDLPRTPSDLRRPPIWPLETRSQKPARLGWRRLVSASCSSARGFATRFLQTVPRGSALALHFISSGLVLRGLSPPGHCPCWAHFSCGRPSAADRPLQRHVIPPRPRFAPIATKLALLNHPEMGQRRGFH